MDLKIPQLPPTEHAMIEQQILDEKGNAVSILCSPDAATIFFSIPGSRNPEKPNKYMWSAYRTGEYLHAAAPSEHVTGLILITGETGCGKTVWLNSFVYHQLKLLPTRKDSSPHVVVVGDPIETWLFQKWVSAGNCRRREMRTLEELGEILQQQASDPVIRFTPRTVGLDVESVDQATRDALRETPKIFVISELRDDADFRAALRLAGTGHLVVATGHATSLVDAMTRLVVVQNAESAADRSMIAQRLSMLVYIKPDSFQLGDGLVKAQIPKLWRNNPLGARSFVADGLSSLQVPGTFALAAGTQRLTTDAGMLSFRHAVEWFKLADAIDETDANQQLWVKMARKADRWDLSLG